MRRDRNRMMFGQEQLLGFVHKRDLSSRSNGGIVVTEYLSVSHTLYCSLASTNTIDIYPQKIRGYESSQCCLNKLD